jgi:hypothetical protein
MKVKNPGTYDCNCVLKNINTFKAAYDCYCVIKNHNTFKATGGQINGISETHEDFRN